MEKAITAVSKSQFIRNAALPICIECMHLVQGLQTTRRCSKFGEKNVISGKITYASAEISRTVENMCSQKGIYFEKK